MRHVWDYLADFAGNLQTKRNIREECVDGVFDPCRGRGSEGGVFFRPFRAFGGAWECSGGLRLRLIWNDLCQRDFLRFFHYFFCRNAMMQAASTMNHSDIVFRPCGAFVVGTAHPTGKKPAGCRRYDNGRTRGVAPTGKGEFLIRDFEFLIWGKSGGCVVPSGLFGHWNFGG
jgi:hypothetical protein